MRNILTVIILFAAATCAPAATKKKTDATTTAAPQAVTIPKDAVANPDGLTWNYTDKQGKKWVYAKTPFGIMKSAVSETATSAAPATDMSTAKAIDKGDSVRFERPGPFGTIAYEKKKSELTDDERHAFEVQNPGTQTVKPQ